MIQVTRLNKSKFMLNCDWIETIEANPDSVITLTNGNKYVVTEKVDELLEKVLEYKQNAGCQLRLPLAASETKEK